MSASPFQEKFSRWSDKWLFPRLPVGSEGRYHARLVLAVSAVVLAFYFLPELILYHVALPGEVGWRDTLIILVSAGLVGLGFTLTVLAHHRVGAWLALIGWTGDLLLDLATGNGFIHSGTFQIWLMFGLGMAFLLLDLRSYVIFAILQAVAGLGVVGLWRHIPLHFLGFSVDLYLASALLLGIGVWLRESEHRQRAAAQAEVEAERAYLQEVIDAVQSPFYVVDARDYRLRLTNRAARALRPDETVTTCYALTYGLSAPCHGKERPCPLSRVVTSREPHVVEHHHVTPQGEERYFEVRGYPLFDEQGHVTQMVEHVVDITQRKQREATLRKFQRAVEYAASGIAITDAKGVFEYVNPALERMTGYRREELVGKATPRVFKSGHHTPEFYAQLWQTILAGQVWQGEILNRRKDGSLYWEWQTIAPVQTDGEIAHFVSVRLDITERKMLETQLREAKEAAEQASAFKSRLLANVSHDMRTPLGAIMGYAEMLQKGVWGEVSPRQQEALQHIREAAERLANLIRGMLTRAELESGHPRLRPHPFAPADLLKAVVTHENVARQKGLAFHTEVDPDLPPSLYGDVYWLQQVLVNLVDNAIKYTSQGGVWVRLRRVDPTHWAIEVEDTGQGIPPEEHQRIFEAFERVAQGDGRKGGLGLGLSIVKEVTALLDGRILLESVPGQGSRFTVVFPLVTPEEAHEKEDGHETASVDHRG